MAKSSFRFEMGGWSSTVIATDITHALRAFKIIFPNHPEEFILNIRVMREQNEIV